MYIIENDGKKRKAYTAICNNCKNDFLRAIRFKKENETVYCSKHCSNESHKQRKKITCDYCNNEFERVQSKIRSKSGLNFCSRDCKDSAQKIKNGFVQIQPSHYNNSVRTYRDLAFDAYEHKCATCDYDETIGILQVHHIDSDRSNNNINNLIILCPNCHAGITYKYAILTETRKLIWNDR